MKTVFQALRDQIHYPIPVGYVENVCVMRELDGNADFTSDIAKSTAFKGALADCLYSLIQAVNFSEADKSVGALTDTQRKAILKLVNKLYGEIGEDEVFDGTPTVYINC